MGQHETGGRADEPPARIDTVDADRQHDGRDHDRRDDQRAEGALARDDEPNEGDGGEGAERGGQRGDHDRYLEAAQREVGEDDAGGGPQQRVRPLARHTHTLSRPRSRSKPITRTTVTTSSTIATAEARLQSSRSTTCVSITIASVMTREPPRRAGVMKKPRAWTKTSRPAAATPGRLSGSVTDRKRRHGPAPMTWAAAGSRGSMFRSDA